MTGLEKLVSENIDEIANGIAWIVVGKPQGKWDMKVVWKELSLDIEFQKARILIERDPNAILVNGYENAWLGIDEDGNYKSVKDIADRIKAGYKAGMCLVTKEDIDRMMTSTEM